MNFGYGDILDYLPSIHRSDLYVAMTLNTIYIAEKIFKYATTNERAMMFLDFCINFEGDSNSELVEFVRYCVGSEVLASSVCGIPMMQIAMRCNRLLAATLYCDVIVPRNEEYDEDTVKRLVEMFKVNFNQVPANHVDAMMRGLEFTKRQILDGADSKKEMPSDPQI